MNVKRSREPLGHLNEVNALSVSNAEAMAAANKRGRQQPPDGPRFVA